MGAARRCVAEQRGERRAVDRGLRRTPPGPRVSVGREPYHPVNVSYRTLASTVVPSSDVVAPRPKPMADPDPCNNHVLDALPGDEAARLFPHLRLVPMPLGRCSTSRATCCATSISRPTRIVSLLYVMEDGASAEIAVVGNEGAIGVVAVHGRRNHAEPRDRAERRLRVSADGPAAQGGVQPPRRDAARAAALHAVADHADGADRGLQPPSLAWISSCAAGCCCRSIACLPTS